MNIDKTKAAIREALSSPMLSAAGGCKYVTDDGKHCVVGQVLSNLGVSDTVLRGFYNDNEIGIHTREELSHVLEKAGLDVSLLRQVQRKFDLENVEEVERLIA
jgi:hypothetical protein